jgi:hypothetical protein
MQTIDKTLTEAFLLSADTFIKYYEKSLEMEVFCIGSILDPRYKDRWVAGVASDTLGQWKNSTKISLVM